MGGEARTRTPGDGSVISSRIKPRPAPLTLFLLVLQTMRRHRNEVSLELRKVRMATRTHG